MDVDHDLWLRHAPCSTSPLLHRGRPRANLHTVQAALPARLSSAHLLRLSLQCFVCSLHSTESASVVWSGATQLTALSLLSIL